MQLDEQKIKHVVREVLSQVLGPEGGTQKDSKKEPPPRVTAPARAETKPSRRQILEEERKKKNQQVMARWLANQDFPRGLVGKFQRQTQSYDPVHAPKQEKKLRDPRYDLIPQPQDKGLLRRILGSSTARLGVWRAGTRPLTRVFLDFISDHAIAKEAVYDEFEASKLGPLGLKEIHSRIKTKEEFLLRPDLGRMLSPESEEYLRSQAPKGADVQIIVSDGLSGIALKVNIESLLPQLVTHLKSRGLNVAPPLYCKYARVILQDRVGEIVGAKTNIIFIGERPGLGTGDGLSAYIIYQPNSESTHANRNCISNIHPRGLKTDDAIKTIDYTLTRMIEQNTSGVDLDLT